MRYVVLRKSKATKEILVTLVVTQRTRYIEELAERIYKLPFAIKGVLVHLNSEKGNAIFVRDGRGRIMTTTIVGQREITEKVGGIEYIIGSGDFFQVNIDVAERLQKDVLEISKEYAEYPMIDLYCGVGLFTLPLAKMHGWAMGVELVDTAIERAKKSAAAQGIHADFVSGDVFEQLDIVERKISTSAPFIVVDPSRSGLADGVAASLDEMNPVAIAYISCHPKSLARDLLDFMEMGWEIKRVELYDMFPHTVHMETLVLLTPPAGRVHQKRVAAPKRHRLKARPSSVVQSAKQRDGADPTPE
jgi:23S rRNA (uracil1939-C5)-methyltransferase